MDPTQIDVGTAPGAVEGGARTRCDRPEHRVEAKASGEILSRPQEPATRRQRIGDGHH